MVASTARRSAQQHRPGQCCWKSSHDGDSRPACRAWLLPSDELAKTAAAAQPATDFPAGPHLPIFRRRDRLWRKPVPPEHWLQQHPPRSTPVGTPPRPRSAPATLAWDRCHRSRHARPHDRKHYTYRCRDGTQSWREHHSATAKAQTAASGPLQVVKGRCREAAYAGKVATIVQIGLHDSLARGPILSDASARSRKTGVRRVFPARNTKRCLAGSRQEGTWQELPVLHWQHCFLLGWQVTKHP
jgi:hypothetical protein